MLGPMDPYTYRLIKENAEEQAREDFEQGEYRGEDWAYFGRSFYDAEWRRLEEGEKEVEGW